MITFQKNLWAPTTEASKEMVVNAESSARTKALIERFRQTGEEQHKLNLASVCYMATFGESQNAKGVKDLWRKQETAHLNGLVVTDFDHVEENLLTLHARWQTMLDFKKEGILKVFVTPSGKGIKVVSKWRKEWGNLAQNQLQMARMLDMERYLDTSGKDASRAAFVPMLGDVLYEDNEVYTYFNPECDEVWGEVYRNESPLPTSPEGKELEAPSLPPPVGEELGLNERQQAIVEALNAFYGPQLGEGTRHATFCQQTAHWLLWTADNNPQTATAMAYELDYVKNWQPRRGEVEELVESAARKKLLQHTPKELAQILQQAGIDTRMPKHKNADPMEDLPFQQWCDEIESLFQEFPCLREVCEHHPRRLWPFLLFASAAMMGTCMTLCYYRFYADTSVRSRLNYIVLGVGDPTSGKGTLSRLQEALLAPIINSDRLADEATNEWKEKTEASGANKEKEIRQRIYNRMFGPRASNTEFIRSMINNKTLVDGEDMNNHLVTVDSEKDNSINMSKSGGWQNRDIMVLKSFHNEFDSQHYSNKQSVSGRFRVYWNQIETCTPPTLRRLVNEHNFNSGLDTRMATIPMGKPDFDMIPLQSETGKLVAANETLKEWSFRLDQRRGELPVWPLVEHVHKWCDEHRAIAEFNDKDQADWLLIKRVPYYGLNVSIPYIDMRHWQEREQTGTYNIDATDLRLCNLVLDIQYRTQLHWFYSLHRKYYDDQLYNYAVQRRRTNKFHECFARLPEEFTIDKFAEVFGYANNRSGQKTLERLIADNTIQRTKRGNYKKLVAELYK